MPQAAGIGALIRQHIGAHARNVPSLRTASCMSCHCRGRVPPYGCSRRDSTTSRAAHQARAARRRPLRVNVLLAPAAADVGRDRGSLFRPGRAGPTAHRAGCAATGSTTTASAFAAGVPDGSHAARLWRHAVLSLDVNRPRTVGRRRQGSLGIADPLERARQVIAWLPWIGRWSTAASAVGTAWNGS
jgi:hypothetical protein